MYTLQLRAKSTPHFAVLMFNRLFKESELGPDYNVLGTGINGFPPKKPLDPERLTFIRLQILNNLSPIEAKNPKKAWSECVTAMNKRMFDVQREHKSYTLIESGSSNSSFKGN